MSSTPDVILEDLQPVKLVQGFILVLPLQLHLNLPPLGISLHTTHISISGLHFVFCHTRHSLAVWRDCNDNWLGRNFAGTICLAAFRLAGHMHVWVAAASP